MMKLLSVLACTTVVAGQSLPTLPPQFETWVACNIVNKNFTVTVHEVFDTATGRALLSSYHPLAASSNTSSNGTTQRSFSTLFDYAQGFYYRTNSSGCFGGNITAPGRRISFAQPGANGQIPSVSQWFEFGSNMNEQFMGSTTYNGENVQQWRADLSNSTANTTMVLNYYFSDPGWTVWNGNGSQYPVALDLVGSRPTFGPIMFPNGSMAGFGPNGTHNYHHVYTFNGFHVGPPRNSHSFELPAGITTCTSTDGTVLVNLPVQSSSSGSSSSTSGVSAGGVVGVAFVSALLGAIIAYFISKRTQRASAPKNSAKFSNVLAEGPGGHDDETAA